MEKIEDCQWQKVNAPRSGKLYEVKAEGGHLMQGTFRYYRSFNQFVLIDNSNGRPITLDLCEVEHFRLKVDQSGK